MNTKQSNNLCWIIYDELRDVLPLIFLKLELENKKSIRLVCSNFRNIIDSNQNLFDLVFQLKIVDESIIGKNEFENIIKQNKIINSLFIDNDRD